ncbi:MAG: glycosyltransferase family 1 protein [Lachnospiraceae bacterium]
MGGMMKIGIDLLWVRVNICGGTESFIRNLLDGFAQFDQEHEYLLFVSRDNAESFAQYDSYAHMTTYTCNVESKSPMKRLLWEQIHLDRLAKRQAVDVMFIPVYSKPFTWMSKLPYVSVIHDLQAAHYPEYFSKGKRILLQWMWWYTCKTSTRVIAISEYGKEDIVKRYPFVERKITTIYNPICTEETTCDRDEIEKKYGVKDGQFMYCLSALLPHKNLKTILEMMSLREEDGQPLLISGVGGNRDELDRLVQEYGVQDKVRFTGFVENKERDWFYEHCSVFLFPSVFEGFGMPPIEAMRKGTKVVMTRESCLEEVTEGKAVYVDNPYDAREWCGKVSEVQGMDREVHLSEQYELSVITKRYIEVIEGIYAL